MFVMITGSPGSGKSAYAVDFMLSHKHDYYNIYANINGLKMHDNIRPLNYREFYEIIQHCKEIYDNQIAVLGEDGQDNIIDAPIRDYLLQVGFIVKNSSYDDYIKAVADREKMSGLFRKVLDLFNPIYSVPEYLPSLFIFDEAQNQFPQVGTNGKDAPADPVISWWVSYHRHLYMDVFLITQYYQKVHKTYRRDIEYFLDAVEASKSLLGALSSSFQYDHYLTTPYYPKNKLPKRKKVKKRKELFEAYESGDKVRTKSAVLPLLLFSFVALALVVVLLYFVKSNLSDGSDSAVSQDKNITKFKKAVSHYVDRKSKSDNFRFDFNFDDARYLALTCISNTCTNQRFNINLNIDNLQDLLKGTDSKMLSSSLLSPNIANLYLLVSPEFLGLFQHRSVKNEKGFTLIK